MDWERATRRHQSEEKNQLRKKYTNEIEWEIDNKMYENKNIKK